MILRHQYNIGSKLRLPYFVQKVLAPPTIITQIISQTHRTHSTSDNTHMHSNIDSPHGTHTHVNQSTFLHHHTNQYHVNLTHAPKDFEPQSALVYDDFITPSEGKAFEHDILNLTKRKRFQKGHWDHVISDYKETELPYYYNDDENGSAAATTTTSTTKQLYSSLSQESNVVIEKVRKHIERTHFRKYSSTPSPDTDEYDDEYDGPTVTWLPCHAIYLKQNGILSAHVDSVKFSGDIVAGLSLCSSSIMRLKPASPTELSSEQQQKDDDYNRSTCSKSLDSVGYVDLYLPPLSLYILSGMSRFEYTHELLPSGGTFHLQTCNGNEEIIVNREDRISIIFRDTKTI